MKYITPVVTSLSLLLFSAVSPVFAEDEWTDDWQETDSAWQGINGFTQLTFAPWLNQEQPKKPQSQALATTLLRAETSVDYSFGQFDVKADTLYDNNKESVDFNIRQLTASFNLSEVAALNSNTDQSWLNQHLLSRLSLKVGRQSLSWGTAELLFINDLFNKDWYAMFTGQTDEYLKLAQDSIKVNYFGDQLNLDLIFLDQNKGDNLISNKNFHLPWQPSAIVNSSGKEFAFRAHTTYLKTDYAVYLNHGQHNTPTVLSQQGVAFYPDLSSFGLSVVTPIAQGLFNFETAVYNLKSHHNSHHYQSRQTKLLIGYEREIKPRLNIGFQYYIESDDIKQADQVILPLSNRKLATIRLRYLSADSKWLHQAMVFHSTNHHDQYLRASTRYRHDDKLTTSVGINLMSGRSNTFFGQLAENDSAFIRLTYFF